MELGAGGSIKSSPSRPPTYTAPSFSWASIMGPINWDHSDGPVRLVCKLESSHIELENPRDPFGRVKDGWIKLLGPTIAVEMGHPPETSGHLLTGRVYHGSGSITAYFDTLWGPTPGTTLTCLIIYIETSSRYRLNYGLVLKPSTTRTGMYERVGCFRDAEAQFFEGSKEASITII
jgi:hypothetical protein